jgi:hypothetical protein
MRVFMRALTPSVEDALDLGVEHLARRAEARDAVAHHAAELARSSKIVTSWPLSASW